MSDVRTMSPRFATDVALTPGDLREIDEAASKIPGQGGRQGGRTQGRVYPRARPRQLRVG